jgi:hypothetical protein
MKQSRLVLRVFSAMAMLLTAAQCAIAQTSNPAGVPVSMVVTAQARHGSTMPGIGRQDVTVYQGRTSVKVTGWTPLQDDRAGAELFVLLDDSRNTSRGSQLEDLRKFILAQPASTKIGVAYMQMGGPQIVQALTSDHALAANSVRPSLSNLASSANPYISLSELMKNWSSGSDRREILMISNGIDYESNDSLDDTYVDSAIAQAQRAGIVVYTISTSGREDSSSVFLNRARNQLSKLADETGGASYYQESGAAVSIAPYLRDSAEQLNHQYLLTFLAQPDKKAGMQSVKLKTEVPNAKLVAAARVYVPAAPQ